MTTAEATPASWDSERCRCSIPNAVTPAWTEPVSYTHLDVYKRQPLHGPVRADGGDILAAGASG